VAEETLHTYPFDASTSPDPFGMDHGAYTVDDATLDTLSVHRGVQVLPR
jgi:hypothetical protein